MREFPESHWDFTDDELADIKLCLNCPEEACTNCLEKSHEPGVRPVRRIDSRRQRAEELFLTTSLAPWKVARLSHMSDASVRKIQASLRAEGRL